MRGSAAFITVAGALLIATAAAAGDGARIARAARDRTGGMRIVQTNGRVVHVKKETGQSETDDIRIAPDRRAVGWLALFPNCCTSYPIPLQLVVWSAGRRRSFRGIGVPVWQWRFVDGGRRVAFAQETVHGGFSIHYEMRDVASGRLVAQWEPEYGSDNAVLAQQDPPPWVAELNAATGARPWR
jgi:hypothetical protein